MQYTKHFKNFLIEHYSVRLKEERLRGNVKAISFCRSTLFNLKKENNEES